MMLNRINYKKGIVIFAMIGAICFLKVLYIDNELSMSSVEFIRYSLVFWGNNHFVNLIWLLPVLMNLLFVSKKYYSKLINFDTRYKNRNNFILNITKKSLSYSFFYNLLLALIQIFMIAILTKNSISFSLETIKFIFSYVLENTFLNFAVIFLALSIKHYMYALLIIITLCIIILTVFSSNIYIPFLSLYWTNNINYITVFLLLGLLFFIRKRYLKLDLGGYENDFRN